MTSSSEAAAKAQRKKAEAAPDVHAWKREFGDKVKVNERTGEYSLNLKDRDDIKKAHQMLEGQRKVEIERGAENQAAMKREKVVRRDGRVLDFPEELVDTAKKGFRPAGRYGGAPSLRFGLSDAFRNHEQGPEGLWFVWNDGWEPTTLWESQAKGDEQHDPDGNLWVRKDGEWLLADEV